MSIVRRGGLFVFSHPEQFFESSVRFGLVPVCLRFDSCHDVDVVRLPSRLDAMGLAEVPFREDFEAVSVLEAETYSAVWFVLVNMTETVL